MLRLSKRLMPSSPLRTDFESASRRRGRHFFLAYGGVAPFNTEASVMGGGRCTTKA